MIDTALDQARRALCGSSSFLIDDWNVSDRVLNAHGWAVGEYPGLWEFRVADARPQQTLNMPSPSLAKVFPFFECADRGAFALSHELAQEDIDTGYVDISLCDSLIGEPLNPWHTTRIPLAHDRWALPNSDQLIRTQGNSSQARYLAYGATVAERIERILERYFDSRIRDLGIVVDWGVGCGRIARQFAARGIHVVGFDIDPENVEWCRINLPGTFTVNQLMPPLPLESNSVHLLYGISVFTHLSSEAAVAWRDEIARVLQPGGICLVTVHGASGMGRILDDDKLLKLARSGYDDSRRDSRLDGSIGDRNYYRATYQTPESARAFFGSCFRFVDQLASANALLQDFIVLQKR